MKLGIIGTGLIVQEFLPELAKLEGLEVKALLSTPRSKETSWLSQPPAMDENRNNI